MNKQIIAIVQVEKNDSLTSFTGDDDLWMLPLGDYKKTRAALQKAGFVKHDSLIEALDSAK